MRRSIAAILSLSAVLGLIVFLLLHAAETQAAALHALQLAATTVIPALFPFCVLSNYLLLSGIAGRWGRTIRFIPKTLFGLEEQTGLAWLLGSLCGFPIGAVVTANLYADGIIRKDSAERILALSTNVSPSFAVAIAGGTVLQSYRAGFLLWGIQIISSLLTGFFLRPTTAPAESATPKHRTSRPLPAFVEAVKTAALTMCHLTGFIVLFSVLLCLMVPLLSVLTVHDIGTVMLSGILELTNGVTSLSRIPLTLPMRFLLLSVMLGFSGFCVHAQVLSFTIPLGLAIKPYLTGKILHGFLAGLLSISVLPFLPDIILTVSDIHPPVTATTEILAFALGSALLFFFFLWKFGTGFGIISNRIRK